MSAPAASWPGTGLAARTAGSRTDGLPDTTSRRGGEHEVGDAREAARMLGDDRRLPDRHAVGRDQREAVLRFEDDGLEAGPRQGLGARAGPRPRPRRDRVPIRTWAIAAMCMRSDAPTEPVRATTGRHAAR